MSYESEPVPETLGDEDARLPRRRRPFIGGARRVRSTRLGWWCVLAVVLVAGAAVVVADGRTRSRESVEVADCQQQLRLATDFAEQRLGLLADYLEPTVAADGQVERLHLADLMSAQAAEVLPQVQQADRYCRCVIPKPWHFSLVEQQATSRAYSAALVTLVQTVAAQGRAPFRADATMLRLRATIGIDGG